MTDINKLAERLRELAELYIPARRDPESALLLQTAANELQRLDSALREHMQLTRDAGRGDPLRRDRRAEGES